MKDWATQPAPTGGIYRHLWLLKTMSNAVGVDLSQAMADGTLGVAEYSQMVSECRFGGCDKACVLWQAKTQGQANSPPDLCANKEALERLKP
ncbi:MAG: hypothetical protein HRU33_18790 [Rhodobacteraceae bacterium]|nr:hypothetical protein [Paracoccaceae bacterium]